MIEKKIYIDADLVGFEMRPRDILQPDEKSIKALAAISTRVYSFRRSEDKKVIAIAGMNLLWTGVAQIWALTSDDLRGSGIAFIKEAKRLIDQAAIDFLVRRYHVIINSGIEENARFARLFGFEKEFTMRHAAPDGTDIDGFVYWPKGV
jgi:hypothetical protein